MKRLLPLLAGLLAMLALAPAYAQVKITDTTHYETQAQMLLANEINESGEPFAEALGYDLDLLDPMVPDFPDPTAYTLGIENYEYSRYQLGTVVSRSGIGLHMAWSPVIHDMAAMITDPDFDGSMTGGIPNGFNEDDVLMHMIMHFGMLANQTPPMGAWPQFGEFIAGNPHYAGPVDPDNFTMDFTSLRWDRSAMDKQLSPGAMGQALMKQYLWAQDMLSGFHDADGEPVTPDGIATPDSANGHFDPDNNIFFGGDGLDGFIGQVLTAESINKIRNLLDNLAYDGSRFGAVDPMTYDPAQGLLYFPHRIAVTEEIVDATMPPRAASFTAADARSDLFDQASLLWGLLNFRNMMNPADTSDEAHVAYRSVFDGDPFPADMSTTGMPGPFDLMQGASMIVFHNIMAMHFDSEAGTFAEFALPAGSNQAALIDTRDANPTPATVGHDGLALRGPNTNIVGAAYTIVALAKFIDEFAGMPAAGEAEDALRTQADFLIDNMTGDRGLYLDRVRIRHRDHTPLGPGKRTLSAQSAAIRGLYAAYVATGESAYLQAADAAYGALVEHYYRPDQEAFATRPHRRLARYNPGNVGLLSGALREARLVGGHQDAVDIYTRFWKNVVNSMQLAEGMNTGETGGDSDGDGIPFIPEQPEGLAPVFAPAATLWLGLDTGSGTERSAEKSGEKLDGPVAALVGNQPNPFNPRTEIRFSLGRNQHVTLAVYDLSGRLVRTLLNGELDAGMHTAVFNGNRQASGLYYYILDSDAGRQVGKMTLVK